MATEKANLSEGKSSISAIWFIPLLALALGVYMVIHNIMTEGPEIEVVFDTAEGLEQGKTKVKYRNVDMGVVEEIRLDEDFDSVIATVKMAREALPLLREDTSFWVVTARVGVGNITGLDTLLSGAYIQMAPGEADLEARRFIALDKPPLTPVGAPGLRLKLTSKHSSSVSSGDFVLYKGFNVGRVESMEFDPEAKVTRYVIFIDTPYHKMVNSATRFWDVSGVSLKASADGFQVETGSLASVLLGGVTFGVPEGVKAGDNVENNTEFKLHASRSQIVANPYRHGTHIVVSFSQSLKGLQPGAPVEYRGIQIGRVERIMLQENTQNLIASGKRATGAPIPVLIYVEPGRIGLPDTPASVALMMENLEKGIPAGLRAGIETGNLLTGAKLITLDYYEQVEEMQLGTFMGFPELPTVETGLGQIEVKVNAILDMVAELPLDDTVNNTNAAIATLEETLSSLNNVVASQGIQELPDELNATLKDLRTTLESLSPDSEIYQSIDSSLLRLNRALGNLQTLTNTLATQPNALLLPVKPTPDPQPEAPK